MALRLACSAFLTAHLAIALPAQDSGPGALISVDFVVATVNDAVILFSELNSATLGEIRSREAELGRSLTPPERQFLFQNNLRLKVEQHALAQAAKTLGVIPPDRVEALLREELEQDEREQIRQLGSMQRLSEERARQNQTWQTYYREKRVEKLASMTHAMAVYQRLQNQRNLFITPRMMRDFYRKHRNLYVHEGAAMLGIVGFLGRDAKATAAAAAAVWREEPLSPRQLVERFEARGAFFVAELIGLTEDSRKSMADNLVDFALAGPAGTVSEPIDQGRSVQLWKVLDHVPATARSFEDEAVQQDIRRRLESRVEQDLRQQTVRRALERTEIWTAR